MGIIGEGSFGRNTALVSLITVRAIGHAHSLRTWAVRVPVDAMCVSATRNTSVQLDNITEGNVY